MQKNCSCVISTITGSILSQCESCKEKGIGREPQKVCSCVISTITGDVITKCDKCKEEEKSGD